MIRSYSTKTTKYSRRIPNAEHQCVGHLISIFFTMRSFYLSIYDVLYREHSYEKYHLIDLLLFKNQTLPSLQWSKSSNNTHGSITAIVDLSVGPKPLNATGYRARTLNDRRCVDEMKFSLITRVFVNRRDFRLFIGDPSDPTKPKANPVVWFTTPLVTVI